jgi:hypothetical protein
MNRFHSGHKYFFAIAAAIALLAISSCKDSSNPITNPDEIVFPDSGISYEKQVQPLFNVGCAYKGCHDSGNNLDLTRYLAWYKNPLVIIPGDTSKSTLVWCIEAQPGSPAMPPAKLLLQNQITGLKRWILEGAKDTP